MERGAKTTPYFKAPGSSGNLQLSFDLPTAAMSYNDTAKRWQVDSSQIKDVDWTIPGRYQLQYSIRDSESDQLATPVMGNLYRSKEGNRAPSAVTLQEPSATAVHRIGLFNWSDATDPDGDAIRYNLVITQNGSSNAVYRQDNLELSRTVIDFKELPITVAAGDYGWQVEAVDGYGAVATNTTGQFTLSFPNDIPAVLAGYLYNNSDSAAIAGAAVTLDGQPVPVESDGSLVTLMTSKGGTLKISKDGYRTKEINLGAAEAGSINQLAIGLDKIAPTGVRYKLNGGSETTAASAVGTNKSDTITLLSTGAALALSSIEKVLGSTAVDQIALDGSGLGQLFRGRKRDEFGSERYHHPADRRPAGREWRRERGRQYQGGYCRPDDRRASGAQGSGERGRQQRQ
ncbi:MAG: hypothetical protein HQL58_02500 [Magnetococcales bacterium]|nr:hypothetical protein [Magnetococcales bacterium]